MIDFSKMLLTDNLYGQIDGLYQQQNNLMNTFVP